MRAGDIVFQTLIVYTSRLSSKPWLKFNCLLDRYYLACHSNIWMLSMIWAAFDCLNKEQKKLLCLFAYWVNKKLYNAMANIFSIDFTLANRICLIVRSVGMCFDVRKLPFKSPWKCKFFNAYHGSIKSLSAAKILVHLPHQEKEFQGRQFPFSALPPECDYFPETKPKLEGK